MTTTITEPNQQAALRIAEELKLLQEHLPIQRRIVHAGDAVYRAGETFGYLYVLTPQGVRQRLQLTQSFLVRKEREYEMLKHQIVSLREELAAQAKAQP